MENSICKPWCLAVVAAFLASPVIAQQVPANGPGAPAHPVHVAGRVLRPTNANELPVGGVTVTLHRVGSDKSGPVDSMRTSASGEYRFAYTPYGADDAVYFAAASYGGIAYFSAPFKSGGEPSREDAEITVFDTTSRAVPVSVRGRHVIVSAPDVEGRRRITEVFELSNDTVLTRVAIGDTGAVWSVQLPKGAMNPSIPEGDVPAQAVQFREGRAGVFAPLSPGVKQLVIAYLLPESAFPLTVPLRTATSVLEVLLEEPTATVQGGGLKAVQPVGLGGRRFQRFLSEDPPATDDFHITTPEIKRPINPWYMAALTVLIGGLMVGTLVYALRRR